MFSCWSGVQSVKAVQRVSNFSFLSHLLHLRWSVHSQGWPHGSCLDTRVAGQREAKLTNSCFLTSQVPRMVRNRISVVSASHREMAEFLLYQSVECQMLASKRMVGLRSHHFQLRGWRFNQ